MSPGYPSADDESAARRTFVRGIVSKAAAVARWSAGTLREYSIRIRNPRLKHAFSITSHLTTEERVTLYRLAQNKTVVCEIGSYIGASACCFGAALKAGSGKILCIDTWNNDAMSEGQRDTRTEFQANTAPYAAHIVPVRGFSTQVVGLVAEHISRVDLLFIDGDHSYEGVKADWDTYQSFLGPGSIIVLHDCGWAEGVGRVIAEDVVGRVSSHDQLPNMWWGTIRA